MAHCTSAHCTPAFIR